MQRPQHSWDAQLNTHIHRTRARFSRRGHFCATHGHIIYIYVYDSKVCVVTNHALLVRIWRHGHTRHAIARARTLSLSMCVHVSRNKFLLHTRCCKMVYLSQCSAHCESEFHENRCQIDSGTTRVHQSWRTSLRSVRITTLSTNRKLCGRKKFHVFWAGMTK